jgi:hypothetical protein
MPNVSSESFTGTRVGDGRVIVPPVGWHTLLGEQVSPAGHEPQLRVLPQPSGIVPHEPAGQVFGVQVCVTQTLLVQVALGAQLPQLSVLPQPSGIVPQFLPCAAHVVGVHPVPV